MHHEQATMILRDRGREPWEVRVLVAFLEGSRALAALPDDADHEDLEVAARGVFANGDSAKTADLVQSILDARRERSHCQLKHIVSLIESVSAGQEEYERDEIEDRVEHLAVMESQIARVGVPRELVVPVAGFLQAADCSVSPADSPSQVRLCIHHAAKRILESLPSYTSRGHE